MAGICNLCGLPEELCICQEIAKEQQTAVISTARRRYGKMVTIVDGIDDAAITSTSLPRLSSQPVPAVELSKGGPSNCKGSTRRGLRRSSSKMDTGWR